MNYLILTPITLFPTIAGNRQRILNVVRHIRAAGNTVSLLFFAQDIGAGLEGIINNNHIDEMKAEVDHFFMVVPDDDFPQQCCEKLALRSRSDPTIDLQYPDWDIDDWYDEKISDAVSHICRTHAIDVMVVNYIWMSKALLSAPHTTLKIIDTHDRMGGRSALLKSHGIPSSHFSVSLADESRALQRADLVLPIQYEEEEYYAASSGKPVLTVGFDVPLTQRPHAPYPDGRRLKVGFLSHRNNLNERCLKEIIHNLQTRPKLSQNIQFHLAGAISQCIATSSDENILKILGGVARPEDFYAQVDVVVNPIPVGTGLKIKTVEALCNDVPIICTREASAGIKTPWPFHRCESTEQVFDYIEQIIDRTLPLDDVMQAGRDVAAHYVKEAREGLDTLANGEQLRRIAQK